MRCTLGYSYVIESSFLHVITCSYIKQGTAGFFYVNIGFVTTAKREVKLKQFQGKPDDLSENSRRIPVIIGGFMKNWGETEADASH